MSRKALSATSALGGSMLARSGTATQLLSPVVELASGLGLGLEIGLALGFALPSGAGLAQGLAKHGENGALSKKASCAFCSGVTIALSTGVLVSMSVSAFSDFTDDSTLVIVPLS